MRARLDPDGVFANAWTDRVLGPVSASSTTGAPSAATVASAGAAAPPARPLTPAQAYARLERATAELQAPFALIDLDAMEANARDMVRRASGKPIRLASKSLRCRALQERVLAGEGFHGTLAFTLPEALWLAGHGAQDIVVAYPTADEAALRELAERVGVGTGSITVMLDSAEQLPLIERAARRIDGARVRVCLDIDAGWRALGGRVRVGVKRSPAHTPAEAAELAAAVCRDSGCARWSGS